MYLKSLTLKGFKSFADRTHMTFDPGLTVVVGPNGSGKSNVSDSILWVLGEQSAKMLRGQAMEDVIFSGSSARQPVGVAEVTLVLDNTDHTLPVDFGEVGITRRMYRSGESEYLINGAPARLMDIQDILHDSGLGKDTHSIISQGKLDSILQSRPEERRALIEEAAGISKHRRRKERSERKLQAMDENLTRAKDISREIARQLRPLERQVNKAQRYNDLTSRLSEITTTLAVDDLRGLQRSWATLETRAKESEAAEDLARYHLSQKSEELEKLQSMLEEKGLFVGDLGEQRRRMQDMLGRIDSDMRLLEEKGRNMVDRLSEMRMTLSNMEKQAHDAADERERVSGELSDAKVTAERLTSDVERLEPEASDASGRRIELDESVAQLTSDMRSRQRAADEATLAYAKLKDAISNAEVEDQMFESRLSQIDDLLSTAEEAKRSGAERVESLGGQLEAAKTAAEGAEARLAEGRESLEKARAAREAARETFEKAKATLSAQRLVDEADQDSSPLISAVESDEGVSGLIESRLGDLIEAPKELESLVEGLLGESLGAMVVADRDGLSKVANVAAGANDVSGQATVMSRGTRALERTSTGSGYRLVDRLDVREGSEGLIEGILGGVWVVDTIDDAIAAHEQDPSLTYVTLSGGMACADGRVVVGTSPDAKRGALERKRRIRSLEEGMDALERAFDEAEKAVAKAQSDVIEANDDAAKAKGDAARLSGELESARGEVSRLESQISQATSERAQVTRRREEAGAKAQEARPRLDEHKAAADAAAAEANELAARIQELADGREAAVEQERDAASKLSEAKLDLATITERRRHLEVRMEELDRRIADLDRRRKATETSARSLEVLRVRVDPLHDRYAAVKDAAMVWAARLRDQASIAEASSADLKKTIGDAKAQVASANEALSAATARSNEIKVESGRLEVQVEEAVKAITATGAVVEEALRLPEPEDRDALEREAASLRGKIAGIGPVNQVAMDEYTRLKERADYIDEQVADLERARTALQKITAAIERKMRHQFRSTFDKVNENFQQIYGLLVPGGSAHLEMTDPEHLAETGIEIVAQPRGKRIMKMTLMSGGEKSLTALALLFAVYRTRTVPFYVFDEVEAALDDANLSKLLDAIETLKESTQLIVISHQRRTMEQADVLYGVSMQADGVSHVVSQRLDHETGKVVDL